MINLPAPFIQQMRELLNDGCDDFLKSYDREIQPSLRINTLKTDKSILDVFSDTTFTPVPWCKEGFYYPQTFKAGKTALHCAGAYYIQESSAMLPVEVLDVKEGDKVLDLCASPGGKSTQIACKLNKTGLLVCNEIVPSRAKILSQNIERLGIVNALVLNESPQSLQDRFEGYFDKILVDAPCSGEGMFNKNPEACKEWNENSPIFCSQRQYEIMQCAIKMLKVGGTLVYSTCTFNKHENEILIDKITKSYPYMQCEKIDFDIPQPELFNIDADAKILENCKRIMPYLTQGEGHFCAKLTKMQSDCDSKKLKPLKREKNNSADKALKEFCNKYLNISLASNLYYGETAYHAPDDCFDIDKLRVLRAGLCLGENVKGRFEPSHSLALALSPSDVKNVIDLKEGSKEAIDYLLGNTIPCECQGWTLVCVNGLSLGWGKASSGILKNHYPKGLRINK